MPQIEVMLEIPLKIAAGLASGQLERVGGVIRKTRSKEIVAWLREGGRIAKDSDIAYGIVRSLLSGNFGAASSGANVIHGLITAHSQYRVAHGLQLIRHRLTFVGALTALNIAIAGYTLLTLGHRIQKLDEHIQQIMKELKINQHVKLLAAIKYAKLVMKSMQTLRDNPAYQLAPLLAAQPLVESRERLLADLDDALNSDVLTAEEMIIAQQNLLMAMHLDTLQVRGFLEIEQIDLARELLDDYKSYFARQTKRLIGHWLGSTRRTMYFHQSVSKRDFAQYIGIEEWLRGDENFLLDLIEEHRDRFWDSEVTSAMKRDSKIKSAEKRLRNIMWPYQTKKQQLPLHLLALEQVEELIEGLERFEGFALEIADLERRNRLASPDEQMSFETWNRLADTTEKGKLEDYDDYVCLVDIQELQKADKVGW